MSEPIADYERFSWEPHTFLNDYGNVKTWSGRKTGTRIIVDEVAKVVIDRLEADLVRARELLECLVDDEECWFDHHGGCQAHGFLSLQPGEMCPHAEARALLTNTTHTGNPATGGDRD